MSAGKSFSGGFFGCFGVGAAVLVALGGIVAIGNCSKETTPIASAPPELTGDALLRSQVGTVPPPQSVIDSAVNAAIKESRITSRLRPEGAKAFYFAGQPMVCGYLADSKARVRFIHRNGNAVVETNHNPKAFDEFWEICRAAGVS